MIVRIVINNKGGTMFQLLTLRCPSPSILYFIYSLYYMSVSSEVCLFSNVSACLFIFPFWKLAIEEI